MASISPPSFAPARASLNNPHKLYSSNFGLTSSQLNKMSPKLGISISKASDFKLCCRCHNRGENSDSARGWDFELGEMLKNAFGWFDDYMRSLRARVLNGGVAVEQGEEEEEDWDWERWRKHFTEVDEQERLVLILKTQLARAIETEDYQAAASMKVAIAAASTNDTVSRVMSHMKKSVEEECYGDAAFWRDYAAGGLVGWWAGTSEDADDPYGRIIHISAEYGRYIARSYSPRQLATGSFGAPVFEVYLTSNQRGEYKQQAVYLKRKGAPRDPYVPTLKPSETTRDLDSLDARNNKSKLFERSIADIEDTEDMDDDSGFDSVLRDMIPGVKVKVVKVTASEKVDKDIISKVIEQIIDEEEEEEEEEENDYDIENIDTEDETKSESENENENDEVLNDMGNDDGDVMTKDDEKTKIAVEVIINDGFIQKMSRGIPQLKDLLRVPARLEKKGRLSFTFTVEEDANEHISCGDEQSSQNKRAKLLGKRSGDHVMLDLVKSIGKGKIPMKVLQDFGELINVTLNQARNRQPLSGSTTFDRIDISSSSDPLDGLYIGTHGLHTSEVIHMKRRFGQWEEGGSTKKPSKLEFYEYVEAVKLTGDPYVPAGQVSFRAKVGKRYQLPHKGILPEEFGVIARYKGQGRLAEAGFQNPRWVDGELVILDGQYIKGGPVVGFVYWAPEYHFLVFFNRLRLQQD